MAKDSESQFRELESQSKKSLAEIGHKLATLARDLNLQLPLPAAPADPPQPRPRRSI